MSGLRCEDVRDALLAGRSPSDPELAEHARGCTECAALLADEGTLGRALASAEPGDASTLLGWPDFERTLERESGWRAWLRSRPTSLRVSLAGAAVLGVTALGVRRLRPDWATLPKTALVAWLVAFVVVAFAAARLALPVLGRAASSRSRVVTWLALGLPAVYALLAAVTLGSAPSMPTARFLGPALACFRYGMLLAVPLLLLLWALDRGGGSRARIVAAAAAGGVAGNAALLLHCPSTDPAHLIVGHAAIGFVLGALAWWRVAR